jgi:excisionase family DNA binding protein
MSYDSPTSADDSSEDQWPGRRKAEPLQRKTLSVSEATQVLGISKWTLYRLLQRNEIKSMKIGARRLIPSTEIDAYVLRNTDETNQW